MTEGVDYSDSRPSPAGLYAAGKRFACRYGGMGTADKWLTATERDALHSAGLAIVANVEGTSRGLIGGARAGAQWATTADNHFRALGMPYNRPIYLSVDWDVQAVEWPTVLQAFQAAALVLGESRVGIYGGRRAIEWAQRDGAAAWFWQTYAWSGSPTTWVPGVHIQQYRNNVTVAGGACDLNRAMTVDYGQWTNGGKAMARDYSPYAVPAEVGDRPDSVLLADLWAQEIYGFSLYDHRTKSPRTQQLDRIEQKLDKLLAVIGAASGDPSAIEAAMAAVLARVGLVVHPNV